MQAAARLIPARWASSSLRVGVVNARSVSSSPMSQPHGRSFPQHSASIPAAFRASAVCGAGHSKWANIKHRKGRQDELRMRKFAKFSSALQAAAREGGTEDNPRLQLLIANAKAINMPKSNIESAIQKGTNKEGDALTSAVYEGYGPGGVALLITALTDNKNRAVQFIRRTLADHSGNLGNAGSVAYLFNKRAVLRIRHNEQMEEVVNWAIENGAEEIDEHDGIIEVVAESAAAMMQMREELATTFPDAHIEYADIENAPSSEVALQSEEERDRLAQLIDALEELYEHATL